MNKSVEDNKDTRKKREQGKEVTIAKRYNPCFEKSKECGRP